MWELDHKEGWASDNWCFQIVVLEKTLVSPLDSKEIKAVNPKGNQHEYSLKELIHLKRPWCWERLKVGGKGDNRGSDDWMVSLTPRTWVWASSRSWWRTAKPGMLQAMGSDTKSWTRLSDWIKLNVHWLWSHFLLIPQLKPVTSDLFTLLQLLTMRLQASSEQFIDFSDCSFFFKTYSSKSFPKTLPS